VSWQEFERLSPMELSWRLWGERRRRHTMLRAIAWAVSTSMQPHVTQSDRGKIGLDRLFMSVTGGDLDEDEVLR
jgi:hypothetical protein